MTQVLSGPLSLAVIIGLVADFYQVKVARLTEVVKGPHKGLLARQVAMYLCQQLGGHCLADIMDAFGLSHRGSVSFITTKIRHQIKANPEFATAIQRATRYIMKHAT